MVDTHTDKEVRYSMFSNKSIFVISSIFVILHFLVEGQVKFKAVLSVNNLTTVFTKNKVISHNFYYI